MSSCTQNFIFLPRLLCPVDASEPLKPLKKRGLGGRSSPFRAPVVIVALYGGRRLLEADVVKAGKGSTTDVLDRVVRDQELLLHVDGDGGSAPGAPAP